MKANEKRAQMGINLLARRLCKTNKRRNQMLVFAMILTTLLFTVLFHITNSFQEMLLQQSLREIGTIAEGGYKDITMEQYLKLKQTNAFDDISYSIYVGNGVNQSFSNRSIEIRYIEEKAAAWNYCELEDGRFPKEKDEIVVDDFFMECYSNRLKLGDSVKISILAAGQTIEKEFKISGYYPGNAMTDVSQFYISQEFVDNLSSELNIDNSQETNNTENSGNVQAFCRTKSKEGVQDYLEMVWKQCGFNDPCNTAVNWVYSSNPISIPLVVILSLIVLIILLSGYLIIYNIFYISITNDTLSDGRLWETITAY